MQWAWQQPVGCDSEVAAEPLPESCPGLGSMGLNCLDALALYQHC